MILIILITLWVAGCNDDKYTDFTDKEGTIEIHRCFCSESAYRFLIVIEANDGFARYNPINLPDDFKDNNYSIVFSGDLLNDSTSVFTNTATDEVIEDFKARNIRLTEIKRLSK